MIIGPKKNLNPTRFIATSFGHGVSAIRLGQVCSLLDSIGGVIESENLPDEISDYIIWGAHNRLRFKDKNADVLFKDALEYQNRHIASSVRSFPLRGADNQAAMVAHMVPISRSAHDIFTNSYAILVLTPVTSKNVPPVDLVRSLFDFTASEARVARGLAGGKSIEEIAADGDVALSTVRTQLRHVMEKTGCTRQAEVVALMANVSLQR